MLYLHFALNLVSILNLCWALKFCTYICVYTQSLPVDRRKTFSLISSRDHCQRSSPSRISDTPQAGFEHAQNLSLGLVEWSYAVVIIITPQRHPLYHHYSWNYVDSCHHSHAFGFEQTLLKGISEISELCCYEVKMHSLFCLWIWRS